jgi:uncharacterized membrane protein YphA (DoxX/SURF4 family)
MAMQSVSVEPRADRESSFVEHSKPESQLSPSSDWRLSSRILFRFGFAYFVLYTLPFPLNAIPLVEFVDRASTYLWNLIVPWVGSHVLHVGYQITVLPSGSGDTTWNYVQVFCVFWLAVIATIVWSMLDRKRRNYTRLHEWLRVYVRFALGVVMIGYGSYKVIQSQFPPPALDRLVQPFGDASPMGLLWTFMGASGSYNVFTGLGEMLGGVLLFARRTTLFGALVSIAVMSHVVALNFSYDVPVKLYSLHLLAMAIVLVIPDARRLANFLLLNRPVEPAKPSPLFVRKGLNRTALVLCGVFLFVSAGASLYGSYAQRVEYDVAERSPLRGIWEVEEFEIDGKIRPLLTTDSAQWRRVIFDYAGVIALQQMNDSRSRYTVVLDTEKKTLDLGKRNDPDWKSSLSYEQPEPAMLTLTGQFDGQQIRAKLRRADESRFLLRNRGFHWINEYPFNR